MSCGIAYNSHRHDERIIDISRATHCHDRTVFLGEFLVYLDGVQYCEQQIQSVLPGLMAKTELVPCYRERC